MIVKSQIITPAVQAWLVPGRTARILHLFDQVCNLVNEDGEVLSLVTAAIGPGPFHLVLGVTRPFTHTLTLAAPVTVQANGVQVGTLVVDISSAACWQPQVAWAGLQAHRAQWQPVVPTIQQMMQQYRARLNLDTAVMQPELENGLARLLAGVRRRHTAGVQEGSARLAGLGPGLTPAGDDILLGVIYGLWATCPQSVAQPLVQVMVDTAVPYTTTLSAAWLQAAARGEAGMVWHELGHRFMVNGHDWEEIVAQILQTGHSSGADALWGFTAVCLTSGQRP